MMSVTGNCSYKYDKNYVLPNYTCRLEKDNTTFVVQEKYAFYHRRRGMTEQSKSDHSKYAYFKDKQYTKTLQEIKSKYDNVGQNSYGCYVKPNS